MSEIIRAGDDLIDPSAINREFRALAASNQWQAYHTPKNLAAALSVEASELLAEFQWLTAEESTELGGEQKVRVADEMADVLMYLIELSTQLDISLNEAVRAKIEKNKIRFVNPTP